MSEDVERVARETCPEGPGHKHDPSRNISCDWSLRHTREVISYLAPAPGECLCYGADGVTDQKCPVCVRADVLAEVSGFLSWLVSLDDTVAGLEERRTVTLSTIIGKARTILDAAPGEQDD